MIFCLRVLCAFSCLFRVCESGWAILGIGLFFHRPFFFFFLDPCIWCCIGSLWSVAYSVVLINPCDRCSASGNSLTELRPKRSSSNWKISCVARRGKKKKKKRPSYRSSRRTTRSGQSASLLYAHDPIGVLLGRESTGLKVSNRSTLVTLDNPNP